METKNYQAKDSAHCHHDTYGDSHHNRHHLVHGHINKKSGYAG